MLTNSSNERQVLMGCPQMQVLCAKARLRANKDRLLVVIVAYPRLADKLSLAVSLENVVVWSTLQYKHNDMTTTVGAIEVRFGKETLTDQSEFDLRIDGQFPLWNQRLINFNTHIDNVIIFRAMWKPKVVL